VDTIFCSSCGLWSHRTCVQMMTDDFQLYSMSKDYFICTGATRYTIIWTLTTYTNVNARFSAEPLCSWHLASSLQSRWTPLLLTTTSPLATVCKTTLKQTVLHLSLLTNQWTRLTVTLLHCPSTLTVHHRRRVLLLPRVLPSMMTSPAKRLTVDSSTYDDQQAQYGRGGDADTPASRQHRSAMHSDREEKQFILIFSASLYALFYIDLSFTCCLIIFYSQKLKSCNIGFP